MVRRCLLIFRCHSCSCVTLFIALVLLLLLHLCEASTDDNGDDAVQRHAYSQRSAPAVPRGAFHPRDFYLDLFDPSQPPPSALAPLAATRGAQDAEAVTPAAFSGHGVSVTLLDTGLCASVSDLSRNDVSCVSVVPGVHCEDAGCEHGTRSATVLAGHLSLANARIQIPSDHSDRREKGSLTASTSNTTTSMPALSSSSSYVGMAPRARVRVVRTFASDGTTRTRYLVAALDLLRREAEAYDTERRQNASFAASYSFSPPPVDVLSLSYGSEDYYGDAPVQRRLQLLMHRYGVVVVAAAGNDAYRFGRVRSPADLPGVLAVGAMRVVQRSATPRPRAGAQGTNATDATAVNSEDAAGQDIMEKSVADFSARGPTTWELPLGAGRVKPDLVALGQHVWAVSGVSVHARHSASTLMRGEERRRKSRNTRHPHHHHLKAARDAASSSTLERNVSLVHMGLRTRVVSGTSIATPIVAGVAALLWEAVRWAAAVEQQQQQQHYPQPHRHARLGSEKREESAGASWLTRVQSAHRVRELLIHTAQPLQPSPWFLQAVYSNAALKPRKRASTQATMHSPLSELAGVQLSQLYAEYVGLTRWSILSQGCGEVQPRAALQRVIDSAYDTINRQATKQGGGRGEKAAQCAPFAVPPTLVIGANFPNYVQSSAAAEGDSNSNNSTTSATTPTLSNAAAAVYWWPYSDMAAYPGAPPLLFNVTVQLCPGEPLALPLPNRSAAFVNKTRGQRESASPHRLRFQLHSVSGLFAHDDIRTGSRERALFTRDTDDNNSILSADAVALNGLLSTHLVRVVMEESYASTASVPGYSPSLLSLSVLLRIPSSAHTRLRYCFHGATPMNRIVLASASSAVADVDVGSSQAALSTCVPLFHVFSSVVVHGAVQVHAGLYHHPQHENGSLLVAVPVTLHISAPPPRAQRVLMDTSLDWLNPTSVASEGGSSFFIPGDDPHESLPWVEGPGMREGGDGDTARAYAEMGGDHPHTNLALLQLYLTHRLGLAVSAFPLLHVATLREPRATAHETSGKGGRRPVSTHVLKRLRGEARAALMATGTLLLVDPERPLSRDMRELLTVAVQPRKSSSATSSYGGADGGLHVVLVTDWYSEEIASTMQWSRDEYDEATEEEKAAAAAAATKQSSTREVDGADGATGELGSVSARAATPSRTLRTGDGDKSTVLRAWVSESAEPPQEDEMPRFCGLKGSCHVPSLNQWLRDLAHARHGAPFVTEIIDNRSSVRKSMHAVRAPFEFSEEVVLDGALTISARRLSTPSSASAAATSSSSSAAAATRQNTLDAVLLRSVAQLNGAGVLQWTQPHSVPSVSSDVWRNTSDSSASSPLPTDVGTATLCNVMPDLSHHQLRLRRRRLTASGASRAARGGGDTAAAAAAADESIYEDAWEALPLPAKAWPSPAAAVQRHTMRIDGVTVTAAAAATTLPSRSPTMAFGDGSDQDSTVFGAPSPVTHGVVGLLTFRSDVSANNATAAASTTLSGSSLFPAPQPGRVAVFTDSNCLSAESRDLQTALRELDGLLRTMEGTAAPTDSPSDSLTTTTTTTKNKSSYDDKDKKEDDYPAAVMRGLLRSAAGRRFLRKESAQSSACVEVVKELLQGVLTGSLKGWQHSAGLACETRKVPPPAVDGDGESRPMSATQDESEEGGTCDEDALQTSPQRAAVSDVTVRLWQEAVLGTDEENCSRDLAAASMEVTSSTAMSAEDARGHVESVLSGNATPLAKALAARYKERCEAAVEATRGALSVGYHGDWDAVAPQHRGRNSQSEVSANRQASLHQRRRSAVQGVIAHNVWGDLYWLRHPVVLAQVLIAVVALVVYAVSYCRKRNP